MQKMTDIRFIDKWNETSKMNFSGLGYERNFHLSSPTGKSMNYTDKNSEFSNTHTQVSRANATDVLLQK